MTVVPMQSLSIIEQSVVSLPLYAQIVEYPECQFFGVNAGVVPYACRDIWGLNQRNQVARYLWQAQQTIETLLGYSIGQRFFADQQQDYSCILLTAHPYVVEFGIQGVANVSLGAAVSYAADPCTIGPIATTVTDTDEIHVYHPGSDIEIIPSSIMIAAGLLNIEIPRCRMVNEASADNPETGLDYADVPPSATSPFEATVDIKRLYTDASSNAVLVTNHNCSVACSYSGCAEYTQTACGYVVDGEIGRVEIFPADYAAGTWTRKACTRSYRWARLYYKAGKEVTEELQDMIVRLAHSLMPEYPCECEQAIRHWKNDRRIPEVLTADRLNCPLGSSDGAWYVWQKINYQSIGKAGIL